MLRRTVAPADLTTLKPLIADSDRFIATHPAGHAVWRSLLQQLSRRGGPATVRAVVAVIERSKPLLAEYRMEYIAAMAKRLSHVIEMFPQRPFAEAFKQLTPEQEIYNQAVRRREWSDLSSRPGAEGVTGIALCGQYAPSRHQRGRRPPWQVGRLCRAARAHHGHTAPAQGSSP